MIEAVDGEQLRMMPEIMRLFLGNDFNCRKGVDSDVRLTVRSTVRHFNKWI